MTEHIKIKRLNNQFGSNNLVLFNSPSLASSATTTILNINHKKTPVIDDGEIEYLMTQEQKQKLDKLKWHDTNSAKLTKSTSTTTMKTKGSVGNSSFTSGINNNKNGKMIVKEKENSHIHNSVDNNGRNLQRSNSANNINGNYNNSKVKLFVHSVDTVEERNRKATEWLHQEKNEVGAIWIMALVIVI